MPAELTARIEPDGVHIQLRSDEGPIPLENWPRFIGDASELAAAVGIVTRLREAETTTETDESLVIPHPVAARLAARDAAALGLPERLGVVLDLRNDGTFDQRDFRFVYRWLRPNGQPLVMPRRVGAFLFVGQHAGRLPYEAFVLATGIDEFNASPSIDPDARYRAWARLQENLPEETSAEIRTSGYLRDVRIAYAGAFSLAIHGDPADVQFSPVLHAGPPKPPSPRDEAETEAFEQPAAGAEEPRSLLPPARQEMFAQRFLAFREARTRYAVGDGWYVVLSPPVQRALKVVRKIQDAAPDIRREFVRNPRAYLREALDGEYDQVVIENLFVETADYSDRVQKIGLWEPKVLPWIVVARQPWLPPERYGIFVAGNRIELQRNEIMPLIADVEAAIGRHEPSVAVHEQLIPATADTLDALNAIAAKLEPQRESEPRPPDAGTPEPGSSAPQARSVLLIEDNLDDLGFEAAFEPRQPLLAKALPPSVKTELKPHQREGVEWLMANWQVGRPGVLLADDMGLGKTLQALAFLAWINRAMRAGQLPRRPVLTVAPAGLLANWEKEHQLHLGEGGLGHIVRAFGSELAALRLRGGREVEVAAPVLDYAKIAEADWVLTTYETLRDYQHSFGKVPFAVIVFDEAQRTKTPGTLMTEAAKAMKANFAVAMTGTPIENRLADLWCITDTVQPGLLGDLKHFSARFERQQNEAELAKLKERLDRGTPMRPAVMLRRLKAHHLPGLPEKLEHPLERTMPTVQADYYRQAIQEARAGPSRGKFLQILQRLRVLSLHPLLPGAVADHEYIAASARYIAMFEILDRIYQAREKALIFVEFLEPQAYLATLLQRRYQLPKPPMLINGTIAGAKRQERVDRFQDGSAGFDVILSSPRAGGVGLTLTAANHVIHLSRWWNPAVEDQCTDRVYRIGQSKPVHVYYPMALLSDDEEHSFDRRLHALLTEKRELSRHMLIPPAPTEEDAQRLYNETVG